MLLSRRELLIGSAAGLALSHTWHDPVHAATRRRALVVGINRYGASAGAARRRAWEDLEGAVNDARTFAALLETRYGFARQDIVLLEDQDATAARIREEFQRHLIDAGSAGDLAVFYFAGHGSRVRNTASVEADGYDDTLVPADAAAGVPDIRDKELARLCRAAARKNVMLTVVLDACHSGGMSRGIWNRETSARNIDPDPRVLDEPPDRDVTGAVEPDPSTLGVLFLAAARKGQVAREGSFPQGPNRRGPVQRHGVFSKALADVLATSAPDASLERIFQRVDVLVRASGSLQEPQLAGVGRRTRGIFGQPADAASRTTFAVAAVNGQEIVLRGGIAAGLSRGCRLRRIAGAGDVSSRAEIEIVDSNLATARAVRPNAADIAVGDLFELERWVAVAGRALRVWVPRNPPTEASVLALAQALDLASRQGAFSLASLTLDPGATRIAAPTHVLSWQNGRWMVEPYPSDDGRSVVISDPARVLDAIPRGARLFSLLPATDTLANVLSFGPGTPHQGVEIVSSPTEADYFLAGRRAGPTSLSYSWCLKDLFERTTRDTPLPLYTEWSADSRALIEFALRLAKVHGWLTLATPPGGADRFPYRLAFERPNGSALSGTDVRMGEAFKLVLQADPADIASFGSSRIVPRYIYVFSIAVNGQATLLFPTEGNRGNLFPRGGEAPLRIDLSGHRDDFSIGPPFGHDSYFLIASVEPLRADELQWDSVVDYATRNAGSWRPEVGFLLRATGTADHTQAWPVSTAWSVQHVSLVSSPR